MRLLSPLLIAALALIGPAPPQAPASASEFAQLRSDGARIPPRRFTDSVALAAGLPSLSDHDLPPGTRELRIRTGLAIAMPQQLYRIVSTNGRVTGQWIRYWYKDELREGWHDHIPTSAVLRYSLEGTCDTMKSLGSFEVCVSRFVKTPDWASVLRRLEADSVWTLPDQKSLAAGPVLVLDGDAISVEARRGTEYRAYGYVNPSANPQPEAKHAANLMGAFDSLWRLIPKSTNIRTYRGQFIRENGRTALINCGDTIEWGLEANLGVLAPRLDSDSDTLSDTLHRAYVEVRGMKALAGLAKQWRSPYPEIIEVDTVLKVKPWRRGECNKRNSGVDE